MLKAMFDIFEPTEKQLTRGALLRLRWAAVIGFFAIPLSAVSQMAPLTGNAKSAIIGLAVVSYFSLCFCLLTRMANRVWTPEKYLDESEIEIKRRSASLTYQTLMVVIALLIVFMMIAVPANGLADGVISARLTVFILGSLLCGAGCLQTGIVAWITKPMTDAEDGPNYLDRRYGLFVILFLVLAGVAGMIVGRLI